MTSVSAPAELKQQLRNALFRVARTDEWSHVREGLMLRDIVPVDHETSYAALLNYETEARELGYPELR